MRWLLVQAQLLSSIDALRPLVGWGLVDLNDLDPEAFFKELTEDGAMAPRAGGSQVLEAAEPERLAVVRVADALEAGGDCLGSRVLKPCGVEPGELGAVADAQEPVRGESSDVLKWPVAPALRYPD
jgi:hypothetical protein